MKRIIFSNMTKQALNKNEDSCIQRCKNRAVVFKALAHPTRIQIVEALAKREQCVNELVELVGDDPSTISKHLTIMKAAGVVINERRGTSVFYSLKMQCVPGFMECVDKAIIQSAREQIGAVG
jgi:DNA-binding transcriptional ArsR family regulator